MSYTPFKTREWTNRLIELVDEGMLNPYDVMHHALGHLSEEDVKQMCQANEYSEIMFPGIDDVDNDVDEDDQPGEDDEDEDEPETIVEMIRRLTQ